MPTDDKHVIDINENAAGLFREEYGRLVALLTSKYGISKIDLVTDAVQDTFETALHKWRFTGIPDNPSAWLYTVARNKLLNVINRSKKSLLTDFSDSSSSEFFDFTEVVNFSEIENDNENIIKLMLACCHESLSERNRIIVILSFVSGFGTREIAKAFLLKTEAVKKIITRAKKLFIVEGPEFLDNTQNSLSHHLDTLLTAIYLIFNEGYKSSNKTEDVNPELSCEATRLAKIISTSYPDDIRVNSILAIFFFSLSRYPARISEGGEWQILARQDRALWLQELIAEGNSYMRRIRKPDSIHRYYIEAVIHSIHCNTPLFQDTDWQKIIYLYKQLEVIASTPVVRLNRIISESYLAPSNEQITELENLEVTFPENELYLLFSAKGDIYFRLRDYNSAHDEFCKALQQTNSGIDTRFFQTRIKECSEYLKKQ